MIRVLLARLSQTAILYILIMLVYCWGQMFRVVTQPLSLSDEKRQKQQRVTYKLSGTRQGDVFLLSVPINDDILKQINEDMTLI